MPAVVAGRRGLTAAQAAARLARDGPNALATAPPPRMWSRVARQLADPLIVLLLAAAAVTVLLRDVPDTLVIVLVVAINTAIGVTQEVRADQAIQALTRMAAPRARVVRDGHDAVLPAAELVRGDLLVLGQGDVVCADATIVVAERLRLDESALTGESVPVSRSVAEDVSAGTSVLAGRARAVVVRTGADSALGRIAALVAAERGGLTPLQLRLRQLGRQLGLIAVVLSAVVVGVGIASGRPAGEMAIAGVSLVVAAIPESLPAVVTLALALGAMRMARGHAIARHLPAVETLGSVTVLSVDKTGTLTQGRMAVERAVVAGGQSVRVRGHGYDPQGAVEPAVTAQLRELARAAVLCNDAELVPPAQDRPEWTVAGDPIEGALLAFAARCGLDVGATRAEHPRVGEEPFDASTRRMTTVHSGPDDRLTVVCKGAPEVVLAAPFVQLPPGAGDALLRTARELAAQGMRVLAVAAAVQPATAPPLPPRPAPAGSAGGGRSGPGGLCRGRGGAGHGQHPACDDHR
jgi:Ca2+-transporting ATPase